MTLYCRGVSSAVFDDYEDGCDDRSPKHRFCHTEDRQVQLELRGQQHVYELDVRWLLAQMLL